MVFTVHAPNYLDHLKLLEIRLVIKRSLNINIIVIAHSNKITIKRMKIQDALDREQSSYKYFSVNNLSLSNQYQNSNSKQAMQNLYKQQLDEFLQEKNKQKEM